MSTSVGDETPPSKKAKIENGTRQTELKSLEGFKFLRVLNESTENKRIVVEGRFKGSDDIAIVILEKVPFNKETLGDGILGESTKLNAEFVNFIYGNYLGFPDPVHNFIKVNVIFPATQQHLDKHTSTPFHVIQETPEMFRSVTQPFLEKESFAMEWVYNILNHEKESERIVYEDPDPEKGFILLPDFKWSGKQTDDLYLIAIVHKHGIRSIRDLNETHLPLLKNILNNGIKAIREKYGLSASQLRMYFHYQPSYYHLHVHFNNIQYIPPGIQVEKAHELTNVIGNIELMSDYYQRSTIAFKVREGEKLFKHYQSAGYCFKSGLQEPRMDPEKMLEFFQLLGQAKHEPCGEHWTVTYGESAWRMAIMALCLPPQVDRKRLAKISLSSAFTSFGKHTDQTSVWADKLSEVWDVLNKLLPPSKAWEFFELYQVHVNTRRGQKGVTGSLEERSYRQLLELEVAFLQWEETCIEKLSEQNEANEVLLTRMAKLGFPGHQKYNMFGDPTELLNMLKFLVQITGCCRLKRTGWVRKGVRDPERVAGHMFRMGVMAMLLDDDSYKDINSGSATILSVIHDMAECIIGDITPEDPMTPEEKHQKEMKAMEDLVKSHPGYLAEEFFTAFKRYEMQEEGDHEAKITKDLDKFDMIMQAYEYETKERTKTKFLQDFFDSTAGVFKTEEVKRWAEALIQKRDK